MLIILPIVFVLTIILGVPVCFCLGLGALAYMVLGQGMPLNLLPTLMFGGIDSFPLMSVPFFIMAGDLLARAGILPKLIDLADGLVGHLRGGLAYVTILSSMFFAGVTGVAVADAAAVGSMLIPGMVKQGYTRPFSAAVTAAASVMGPIIPPSVAMLIFACVYGGGISVAKMFLMGAVPGVIIGLGLMALVRLLSGKYRIPLSQQNFNLVKLGRSFVAALPGLMVPFIILGGIIGGIFTPTEAGAVAVAYGLLVGLFLTRRLRLKDIAACFLASCKTSAMVFMMLATAKVVSFILTAHQVPALIGQLFTQMTSSPYIFLLLTIFFLWLLGFVLEAVATMIMLIPILAPIAVAYGLEPHHFGLIIVMTVQVALLTPPVALSLFICCPLAECSLEDAALEVWPFMGFILAVIALVAFWPGVSTWLPRLFSF
ncbi:MAG: TRAP transporter large permease [Thermodesulfobacteriota bacterium]